ncbi:DUF3270 family protein [Streptococcus sp. X16XC17]|uniref:DUF3270 family protein n=1 Tax=unclassified Streptococcus TaxID=2608887 RepID=UPI00066FE942|nr:MULTISPECIES: DUF3270 family protein [unclassified Streptococcus]TCD46169.1 DUF3270 family protein [Streptococcus sp. X16XC17]
MALPNYRSDHQYENTTPKENLVSYQEYHASNYQQQQLREVLFFVNITIFAILTVFSAYIYLTLEIPIFIAFILATATGALGLKLVQFATKRQYQKFRKKKYGR